MIISQFDFPKFINSINRCYAKDILEDLPKPSDFPSSIFDRNGNLNIEDIINFADNASDDFLKSVVKRMLAVINIQKSRDEGVDLNIKATWQLILESIYFLPSENIISSIGSQGFLSIPLYKYDLELENFDFIRFHIWDNSLRSLINLEICERLSIHTHSFFAKSWIICGKLVNECYSVMETNKPTDFSLFTVGYNKTLNEVNQHTSVATNTGNNVLVNLTERRTYQSGDSYNVEAGHYHKSLSLGEDGLAATFFSFTAKDGIVDKSYVVGPREIDISEVNRKIQIDPTDLINKIDSIVCNYER
jgi:hypothetical protein